MAAAVSADKNVVGLLNGLAKRQFFGESEITDSFLKVELFPDLTDEEFEAMLGKYELLLRNIVASDMDFNQLEAFLTSQTKKREGALKLEQAAAFMKFWKSQKTKIHDSLVQKASWNNKLKDVSWRIDLKTQARSIEQINTPVAIVEMQVENAATRHNGKNGNKDVDIFQFEMDESQINKLVSNIEDIEKQLASYAQS
ncbi:COMM domain-containing protein 1-like [Actinia tenebrosa]|uniref:COMM domain-containing protein 1 n=1 Tax=Actinia tenebrosa TaxID=6105 RepID=A0A6P8HC97_ACTTE|nr:COMM domain-containing protein 1-like [Actinia tenebrosa]